MQHALNQVAQRGGHRPRPGCVIRGPRRHSLRFPYSDFAAVPAGRGGQQVAKRCRRGSSSGAGGCLSSLRLCTLLVHRRRLISQLALVHLAHELAPRLRRHHRHAAHGQPLERAGGVAQRAGPDVHNKHARRGRQRLLRVPQPLPGLCAAPASARHTAQGHMRTHRRPAPRRALREQSPPRRPQARGAPCEQRGGEQRHSRPARTAVAGRAWQCANALGAGSTCNNRRQGLGCAPQQQRLWRHGVQRGKRRLEQRAQRGGRVAQEPPRLQQHRRSRHRQVLAFVVLVVARGGVAFRLRKHALRSLSGLSEGAGHQQPLSLSPGTAA